MPRSSEFGARRPITPIVIAPDIILDLIYSRGEWADHAARLFDAIDADVEAGREDRRAYIAPLTVPMMYLLARRSAGIPVARQITGDLMRLVRVAPLGNYDYYDALWLTDFEYEEALQFVACRRVGANYLVTRDRSNRHRTPVERRTAREIMPLFRR